MTLFLFLKQLVDVLYQYRTLDYLMVGLVLVMLVYQVALVRPNIRKRVTVADVLILTFVVLLTISFVKDVSCYGMYFKILSAFLMYFVGRIYYDRIQECYGALVSAGYIVVYLNFFNRFMKFGVNLVNVTNADGDLYYYDTDMAFAMILALVFILMFGHNTLFKYFTVFIACPYMVFRSDAGIQMVLMLIVYVVLCIYIMELVLENQKVPNALLALLIIGLLGIVVIIHLPVFGVAQDDTILALFGSRFLDNDNMYGRYDVWQQVLTEVQQQDVIGQLFGLSLGKNMNVGSLYIKTIYSMGYIGLALMIFFVLNVVYYVVKVHDRKTFYVTTILAIMLLGTGVTVTTMEFTQMSWFPMMFAGMVVSSVQAEKMPTEYQ